MPGIYVGTENFARLIESDAVYIDKTAWLPQLFCGQLPSGETCSNDAVMLFTRPRRFGKTLSMSMIRCFFELNYADPADKSRTQSLFENLAVSRNTTFCHKHQGAYPVVSISLKDAEGENFQTALNSLLTLVFNLYESFRFVLQSPELEPELRDNYQHILKFTGLSGRTGTTEYLSSATEIICASLQFLTICLYRVFHQKTIVLVDEYDVPLQKAAACGYYDEMLSVVRGMLSRVFKTNDYLEKGIVTGCLRISHESIFTGINNFSVYTVNDTPYSSFIGFTADETLMLLSSLGLNSATDRVMQWYNGYNFGGTSMLCPWSVLKFCSDAARNADRQMQPQNYWGNSSGNDIIEICMKRPNAKDSLRLQNLLDGNSEIISAQDFTAYPDINARTGFDTLLGMMLSTGYLTAVRTLPDRRLEVRIPNLEILDCFRLKAAAIFSAGNESWYEKALSLKEALFSHDRDQVQNLINDLLLTFVSVRNTANESFYHGFLLGVLSLTVSSSAELRSEAENGFGFADLTVKNGMSAVIIEFKKVPADSPPVVLQETCAEALRQITACRYDLHLKQDGYTEILPYGIAFAGKSCLVMS